MISSFTPLLLRSIINHQLSGEGKHQLWGSDVFLALDLVLGSWCGGGKRISIYKETEWTDGKHQQDSGPTIKHNSVGASLGYYNLRKDFLYWR